MDNMMIREMMTWMLKDFKRRFLRQEDSSRLNERSLEWKWSCYSSQISHLFLPESFCLLWWLCWEEYLRIVHPHRLHTWSSWQTSLPSLDESVSFLAKESDRHQDISVIKQNKNSQSVCRRRGHGHVILKREAWRWSILPVIESRLDSQEGDKGRVLLMGSDKKRTLLRQELTHLKPEGDVSVTQCLHE